MTTRRNDPGADYGMQRREFTAPQAHNPRRQHCPNMTEETWARFEAEKAAQEAEEPARKLKAEIDAAAGMLEGHYGPLMSYVESIGWTVPPYPLKGEPKVDRVTLRGLDSMSVAEAVCKGILTSRGLDEHVYWRAVERRFREMNGGASVTATPLISTIPHSAYDEHGFPEGDL